MARRATTFLQPYLEYLARFRVLVYTPGMDDRGDQMTNTAKIRALPVGDRELVKARVAELRAEFDQYSGRYAWQVTREELEELASR